jgi:hypothetical protein
MLKLILGAMLMISAFASVADANHVAACTASPACTFCYWCDVDQGVAVNAGGHSASVYVDAFSAPAPVGFPYNEYLEVCVDGACTEFN